MQDVTLLIAGIKEVDRAAQALIDLATDAMEALPEDRDAELEEFDALFTSICDRLCVMADLMGMSEGQLRAYAGLGPED